jgi:hypothetical protein
MALPESQARVRARIWQAIAQSELDLSGVPQENMEELVNLTTEAALLELDDEIGSSLKEKNGANGRLSPPADTRETEQILWEGRPFLSITIRYMITNERVRIIEGLVGKSREDIELVKIRDMSQSQTVGERLLNLGDVTIRSNDVSHPEVVLNNIKDPTAVHEILRRAVLQAREKFGLTYREEM